MSTFIITKPGGEQETIEARNFVEALRHVREHKMKGVEISKDWSKETDNGPAIRPEQSVSKVL